MADTQTSLKCKILLDILKEKAELLEQISALTLNQHTVLESNIYDQSIYEELSKEKETRIHRINELDNFFQSIFDQVKRFLDEDHWSLKETIKFLQQEIKKVSELTIQIQLYEEKNRQILQDKFGSTSQRLKNITQGRTQVVQSYKQQSSFRKKNN